MILKNKNIVILGNTRFDSPIQATSLFIARNLSKENKVFFIDYPFTLKDYIKQSDNVKLKERKEKFSIFSDGILDSEMPNLKVIITPPLLPINFLPEGFLFNFLLMINEYIIALRLKKIFRSHGITDFIYFNSFNFHYPGIAKFIKPILTAYHCVDPMIIPYDMKHGIKAENELVKESDVVICTSKALYLQKKESNENTYFVPNGTDAVQQVADTGIAIHNKLKEFPKPIIGYLGTIERRINYDLVEKLALENPDKSFVFAGPVLDNYVPDALYKIPNIHFIGPIAYEEVPQIINGFDLAIIPFKKDKVSNTIFPIKLFEYLSAGKAVIASDFNDDLKDFTGDVVDYCADAASFTMKINETLNNDSPEKIAARKELAKQNTWEKRSEMIAEIIYTHLPEVKNV